MAPRWVSRSVRPARPTPIAHSQYMSTGGRTPDPTHPIAAECHSSFMQDVEARLLALGGIASQVGEPVNTNAEEQNTPASVTSLHRADNARLGDFYPIHGPSPFRAQPPDTRKRAGTNEVINNGDHTQRLYGIASSWCQNRRMMPSWRDILLLFTFCLVGCTIYTSTRSLGPGRET